MRLAALLCFSALLSACWPCGPDDETDPTVESTATDTVTPAACEPLRPDCYTSPPSAAPPCDIDFPGTNPWACDDGDAAPDGCQKAAFAVACPCSPNRTLYCCP